MQLPKGIEHSFVRKGNATIRNTKMQLPNQKERGYLKERI